MTTIKNWPARYRENFKGDVHAKDQISEAMQAEINALRAEVERLKAALRLFADALPLDRSTNKTCYGVTDSMRDAAHAALQGEEP